MTWINYFVTGLDGAGTEGHLPAEKLAEVLASHKGGEAYHCAFDLVDSELKLEEATDEFDDKGKRKYRYHAQSPEALKRWPKTVSKYTGPMRPALGWVWLDFDSHDGGVLAWKHVNEACELLGATPYVLCYSGSKGFHLGVPLGAFNIAVGPQLGEQLHSVAKRLKKEKWDSLDTTVFNANRKFRALGSKHPKTGLFKILLEKNPKNYTLDSIKALAKKRGSTAVPQAPMGAAPLEFLKPSAVQATRTDAMSVELWRKYRQPEGSAALEECEFLKWAKTNPAKVNEPQWYACASIVGRFKDGRTKFHIMSKGHPGYSTSVTDEKLEQALEASGPRTCKGIGEIFDGCKSCRHYQKIQSPIVILEADLIPTEATGFYDLIENEKTGAIKYVPNYADMLRAFKRESPYKTIADMKAVFTFCGTHYVECTPIEIKGFAERNFDPEPNERYRQEFMHKVLANEIVKRTFFGQGTDGKINFKNGVLNLETKELEPHSHELGFRHVLPYEYDPQAQCPSFDAWIDDVMLGDRELVAILQEYMGYVVRGGDYKYHKALWLSGSGRNGKSTFLSVLKALIGTGNYSTLSIRQIINDKFSSADLDGKIANFSEETSPEELSDSGPFKNLTGDGELIAQKKYGDPYSFRNRAKLIMTYNEIPNLKDLSPGMLSRPIIVPWKKDLTDESTQDRNLKSKLLAELPGIFNFALAGWERLDSAEQFTKSEKSSLAMEEIRNQSSTAIAWVLENVSFVDLKHSDKTIMNPKALYEAYKLSIGQFAYAAPKFFRHINELPEIKKRRRRIEKGTEYFAMRLGSGTVDF